MLEKNDWAAAGVQTAARTPAAHAAPARKRASIARPRMIECQMSGSIPFRRSLGLYRSWDGWSTVWAGRPRRLWCSVAEKPRLDASRRYLGVGQQEYCTVFAPRRLSVRGGVGPCLSASTQENQTSTRHVSSNAQREPL